MQRKYEYRLLFLKQFTKELIIQSKTEEVRFESEQTTSEPPISEQKEFEIKVPVKLTEEIHKELRPEYLKLVNLPKPKPPQRQRYRVKTIPQHYTPQKPKLGMTMPLEREMKGMQASITDQPFSAAQPQTQFQPYPQFIVQPRATSRTIDLKKLNPVVQDPRVTLIECTGPGKFILVRTAGQTTVTKISLNKNEIQNILNTFSQEAKVPVISGLFKAAVGNLVITAVISELVGSRFIINKLTPRLMLEQRANLY